MAVKLEFTKRPIKIIFKSSEIGCTKNEWCYPLDSELSKYLP